MLRRRLLVGAVGVFLAGCSSATPPSGSRPERSSPSPETATPPRRWEALRADCVGRGHRLTRQDLPVGVRLYHIDTPTGTDPRPTLVLPDGGYDAPFSDESLRTIAAWLDDLHAKAGG